MTRWLPLCWAALLGALLLGPALAPGYVLVRDMVWVPDLALRPDALGLGSALPRAVPSDAVVALLDEAVPGMLLQKLVLLGALVGAGTGAAALVGGGLVARLAAVSVTVWNPFVVERLAIGHWPVLLGYAAVPWLAVAGRRVAATGRVPAWVAPVLLVGSLSASAGLASAAVLLATGLAAGVRRRAAVLLALAVVAANGPWLVAGLAHASAASGAGGYRVFATAADGLPAPLAALTLGGIWNAAVVPASRDGAAAWVSLALLVAAVAAGARRWRASQGPPQAAAQLALWLLGVGIATVSWAAPAALEAVGDVVPGAGVLRDGSRLLALALPVTAGLVGHGAEAAVGLARQTVGRWSLAVAVLLLPLAVLPDAAWGIGGRLDAVRYPAEWLAVRSAVPAGPGEAVLLPWGAYRAPAWNGHRPVLDPLGRLLATGTVADGDLVVGPATVAGEDPRARQADEALRRPTPRSRAAALRDLGIGWVVVEKDAGPAPAVAGAAAHDGPLLRVVRLAGPTRPAKPGAVPVAAQSAAWIGFGGLLAVGILGGVRRAGVTMATRRSRTATVRD